MLGIWRTNYIQFGFITKIKIQDLGISRIICLLIHLLDNLQVSMVFHGFSRFFLAGTDCQQTIQIQTINLSVRSVRIGIEEWDKMRMSWDNYIYYIYIDTQLTKNILYNDLAYL